MKSAIFCACLALLCALASAKVDVKIYKEVAFGKNGQDQGFENYQPYYGYRQNWFYPEEKTYYRYGEKSYNPEIESNYIHGQQWYNPEEKPYYGYGQDWFKWYNPEVSSKYQDLEYYWPKEVRSENPFWSQLGQSKFVAPYYQKNVLPYYQQNVLPYYQQNVLPYHQQYVAPYQQEFVMPYHQYYQYQPVERV